MSKRKLHLTHSGGRSQTKKIPRSLLLAAVTLFITALLTSDVSVWWPLLLVFPAIWVARSQGAIVALALAAAGLGPLWFYSHRGAALRVPELQLWTTILTVIVCSFAFDRVVPETKEPESWQLPADPVTLIEREMVEFPEKKRTAA